jgi:phage terminase large subunit-like protein
MQNLTADTLRQLPKKDLKELLSKLTPKQAEDLKYNWEFWARPKQLPPEGDDWNTWFLNQGRGAGKTRTGVEWCRAQIKAGHKRGAAVASTNSDIERVMVKGESGFLNHCSKNDRDHKGKLIGMPLWSPTKRALTWHEGGDHSKREIARIECYSAEEPERLRGPQFSFAWGDELAAWNKDEDTWNMLQFCLRLGKHPRVIVTTTPKPTKLVRKLLKDPKTVVTTGSTFENSANLANTYIEAVKAQYEGTRLGKQELYAEMLEEAEGALWTTDLRWLSDSP